MKRPIAPTTGLRVRLPYYLLVSLIAIVWFAGGASRPEAAGQPVVRFFAALALAACLAFAPLPRLRIAKIPAIFAALAVGLVLLQLVPLPPAVWTALPGRSLLAGVSAITGDPLPWRPLSMSPGWTLNALGSLIVPVAVLVLASNVDRDRHLNLLSILVGLALISALLGLVQLSGGRFDHPLINDTLGMVSGTFANRNHFALYLAISCVLAWAWAASRPEARWRVPAAFAISVFFALLILATGSRAGLALLLVSALASSVLARIAMKGQLAPRQRRLALVGVGAAVLTIAVLIAISLAQDRAESVSRVALGGAEADLRLRLIPLTVGLISEYFPFGAGAGTFDPVFRISEPTDLLGPAYFNHAHSDVVEVALEGGLVSILILLGAFVWIAHAAWRAWRPAPQSQPSVLARTGTASLILILLASATDYPARTPMVMALVALAAVWVSLPGRPAGTKRSAPPLNSDSDASMAQ